MNGMVTKNRMTWQYVAGFFDGEGNINICPSRGRSWPARIVQSETRVLNTISEFLKGNGIESHLYHSYKAGQYKNAKKDLWCLQITGESNTRVFLQGILPFLIVKKLLVQDVLRFFKIYPIRNPNAHGFITRKLNGIKQISSKNRVVSVSVA